MFSSSNGFYLNNNSQAQTKHFTYQPQTPIKITSNSFENEFDNCFKFETKQTNKSICMIY